MQIALLGPLEVTENGRPVPVSGSRLRTLLLRLACDPERAVSAAELVEAVWGEQRPADETNALQTLVSRLRRALGTATAIQQIGTGYRLREVDTDLDRFRVAVAQAGALAASGELAAAAEEYRGALALWRGPALAEVEGAQWADVPATRWQDERLTALTARIDCDLRLGRAEEVIGELTELTRLYPLTERFSLTLMTALAAQGRAAEALAAFDRLRRTLADELGVDPSPELRAAHAALLRGSDAGSDTGSGSARAAHRTNLRASLTSFLGREEEVKRLSDLLDAGRLVTLVGPGGAGKTRLAGVAAAQWLDRMPDGVWLIELAPVTDEANIAQAVLTALGMWADRLLERGMEGTRKSAADRLLDVLSTARCLLVVDNCEHLISGVAGVVDELLRSCPGVKVLATSREPLGIDGEALCMIPPLTLPEAGAGPEIAAGYPSVQLFVDRAAAVSADFGIDAATVDPVVEIVRRLDGLPLAIELAAARLRVLPVAEVATRLSDRFRLLTGGSRIAMPRHRTLRAVVEWSWDLLTGSERLLAERLAIFASGATVDSAQAVCADSRLPADEVQELLSALVDKSLLKVGPDADGGSIRYQMLETIREYGIERLAERDELSGLRLTYARYFARLAARHTKGLQGTEQLAHLHGLEAERDNILAGLGYLIDSGTDPAGALAMAYSLCWYWMMLGRHSEATRWLGAVLDATTEQHGGRRLLVKAMFELNLIASDFGSDARSSSEAGREIGELYEQLAEVPADLDPTLPLLRAILAFFGGTAEQSLRVLEPALASEDDWIRAAALMFRANVHENEGNLPGMRADAEAALTLFNRVGDRWGMATTGSVLAQLKVLDGDLAGAVADYERSSAYLAEFGARADQAMLRVELAELYIRTGDLESARAQVAKALDGEFQLGDGVQRMMTHAVEASIAWVEDDLPAVDRLLVRLDEDLARLVPSNPMNGHVLANALATVALLRVRTGDLAEARRRLDLGYPHGLHTQDMPIMSNLGLASANWAAAMGAYSDAAQIFGAAARLRGAPDPTNPYGLRLRDLLVAALGSEQYEAEFAAGQALDREAALDRVDPATVRLPAG